jgi:hypothetical protein
MTSSIARVLAPPLFLSAILCCGGSTGGTTSHGDGGIPPAEDSPGASCPTNLSGTPAGRPVAMTCAPTTVVVPPPDGGVTSCTTDADCGSNTPYSWCRAGKCQVDQCFTDGDCASGEACSCANEQIGNAVHTNRCVQTQCHVDSDCGNGEVCSRTATDLCASSNAFLACHSPADQCRVDADCCSSAPACRFQATVGHWECAAVCTAAG